MKYTDAQIAKRVDNCPKLASLRSINNALSELVNAEQSFTSQIAEIIRRDPTLTTRLLKLVNSVFFGLSKRVTNIEDAIFYLGLKQIRELALATPVIEDFNKMNNKASSVDWKLLWQHSIGTAIVTREIASMANILFDDDTDYIAGLVHNVGLIVMSSAFNEEFEAMISEPADSLEALCQLEQRTIGWDHAKIGAQFLKRHKLSDDVVNSVEFHHDPENGGENAKLSAAVQIADYMVRSVGITSIENVAPVEENGWAELSGWRILFGDNDPESQFGMASLRHTLKRLPGVLQGLL